jgi:hypothetical protein
MEDVDNERQTGDQPPALGALAEVPGHPRSATRPQLPIEIVRHPVRSPPVIAAESHSGEEGAHSE